VPGHADEVTANPNDPGKVTSIGAGVKEIDLGGIFVFTVDKVGDSSTTKLSTLGGLGFQYYFNANVSLRATGLFAADSRSPSATCSDVSRRSEIELARS
jgi:hypothetical protein